MGDADTKGEIINVCMLERRGFKFCLGLVCMFEGEFLYLMFILFFLHMMWCLFTEIRFSYFVVGMSH
jgi:hypothetical protein